MRAALLSDIHGNSIALDAVLADIAAQGGADAHFILGDLIALGPDPVGVLEHLSALADVRFIRGNPDRYATLGDRPGATLADLRPAADQYAGATGQKLPKLFCNLALETASIPSPAKVAAQVY